MEIVNLHQACSDCMKVVGSSVSAVDEDALFDVAENLTSETTHVIPLQCQTCHKCAFIQFGEAYYSIESLLTANHQKDGLHKLEEDENPYLILLLELCYNRCERDGSLHESPFLCTFLFTDIIKLIWKDGQAVGFYVLKLQGSPLSSTAAAAVRVLLPMLDVLYVRRAFRRQGLGRAVLTDALNQTLDAPHAPCKDLAVSEPVSLSLLKVLESYLTEHPRYRDNIWSCTYTGEDGYRKNIWLELQRKKREKPESQQVAAAH